MINHFDSTGQLVQEKKKIGCHLKSVDNFDRIFLVHTQGHVCIFCDICAQYQVLQNLFIDANDNNSDTPRTIHDCTGQII